MIKYQSLYFYLTDSGLVNTPLSDCSKLGTLADEFYNAKSATMHT